MKIIGEFDKPMSQREFTEYKGTCCPYCNCEDIVNEGACSESFDMGTTTIRKCDHCKNKWIERKKLVGYIRIGKEEV
tara:strand:+ start:257 stop:487 length:231 start_codon:yes stop_codon:yes gene_type:complete